MTEKNPKNSWHGIPREDIEWHPAIEEDLCIGCGICYLGCGAKVFEFDTEKNKPVVANPLKCKVGCVTCANTCPVNAISFPPLTYIHKLIKDHKVIAFARNEIKSEKNRS